MTADRKIGHACSSYVAGGGCWLACRRCGGGVGAGGYTVSGRVVAFTLGVMSDMLSVPGWRKSDRWAPPAKYKGQSPETEVQSLKSRGQSLRVGFRSFWWVARSHVFFFRILLLYFLLIGWGAGPPKSQLENLLVQAGLCWIRSEQGCVYTGQPPEMPMARWDLHGISSTGRRIEVDIHRPFFC